MAVTRLRRPRTRLSPAAVSTSRSWPAHATLWPGDQGTAALLPPGHDADHRSCRRHTRRPWRIGGGGRDRDRRRGVGQTAGGPAGGGGVQRLPGHPPAITLRRVQPEPTAANRGVPHQREPLRSCEIRIGDLCRCSPRTRRPERRQRKRRPNCTPLNRLHCKPSL